MRVTVSIVVNSTAERLFWLSQNYERRLEWDIYLAEAYLLHNEPQAAIGVESFCRNKSGSSLTSKYISFAPPTHAAVEMTQGPWIIQRFGGTWRFKEFRPGETEVRFVYNFTCRPAMLRGLIEPVVGLIYRRDMERRLEAFKIWAEANPE